MDYQTSLRNFNPEHEFFVGIDSDGCVFDTMEVKQKEIFIPNALKYFNLYSISKILRETGEFVNLYSVHRGGNRFISLLKVFELLSERKEIISAGYELPDMSPLREWVETETKLGNDNLRKYFESNYNPELEKVVRWSEAVNKEITDWLRNIPPFPYARRSLETIASCADIVIVSQTPLEALNREWEEHGLRKYARFIAGQEHGTKTEHIAMGSKGKYTAGNVLMIGDAKGDLDAARNNGVLFFPILPGKEDSSWKLFLNEGLEKFRRYAYAGRYEDELITEFLRSLPERPPWALNK
jgi:phosphoglycolate phosphatase-like HAD superfamily hydrolase